MKKLLSLLSVLNISGTAVPTTIAASPYQKEETKLENNDINYLKTNNLKKLNKRKRDINQINNLINKIKNIKFNSILKYFFINIDVNARAENMFVWENLLYFKFSDIPYWYEFNPQTKNIIKTEKNHNVYQLDSNFINKNKNNPILYNKEFFILKDNFFNNKVYQKNINNEQDIIIDGNIKIKGITLNNKIYFLGYNRKLYWDWAFESILEQYESIINWKKIFNDWKNNIKFDFKNNFLSKSENEKQLWINNKKHKLLVKINNFKDKINIIKNRESIEQLKIQFSNLENTINDLKLKINNLLNDYSDLSINCANISTIIAVETSLTALAVTSTPVPAVGVLLGGVITIIAGSCAIDNA